MLRSLLSPLGIGENEESTGIVEPVILGGLSLAGYAMFYTQNIFLARNLTREEFNDYNVGVSSLLLLAALAPLGLEKLSLKIVPVHIHQQEWPRLRGFIRFAILIALLMSLLLALTFDTLLGSALQLKFLYNHLAIPLIIASLPLLAVFFVLMEVATASGAPLLAAALYRLILPVVMLSLNVGLAQSLEAVNGATASCSFVTAWFVAVVAMSLLTRRQIAAQIATAQPVYNRFSWLAQATPLLLHGLLLTVISQSGVIILELSERYHDEASVFAVAMQTGAVIVLFATSANRFYLPQVSVLLRTRDTAGLRRLAQRRLLVVGGICLLFFALITALGDAALRAHGKGFEEGYLATCVIAFGASISTTFSLSPFGLYFVGLNMYVLRCIFLATLACIVSCIFLVEQYGALGAAIAYSVPVVVLHLWLAYKSKRLLDNGTRVQQ